jgi:UDP-perosamine 4-acetyltransferase
MDRELFQSQSGESHERISGIVVIGGGGHAKVVISILKKLKTYTILGYADRIDKGELSGARYLGTDSEIAGMVSRSEITNGVLGVGQIGSGKSRYEIWRRLCSKLLAFPKIISPDAIVNDGVIADDGVVVMDGAIINTGAWLGIGVIANTHCTIEHDVRLEDWVHVAPGATVSGGVTVGRFSMIGAGATVIEGKRIGAEIVVGAGATVVSDLDEPGVYIGTPARRMK